MNRQPNDFFSNLTQAARDNPLAAALVGGGALWMLLGNRALSQLASGVASGAQSVAETGRRGVSGVADAVSTAGSRVGETVTEGAKSFTRATSDVAEKGASAVRSRVDELVGNARDAADLMGQAADVPHRSLRSLPDPLPPLREGYASAQSALTDLLERQPLMIGAIGLAIGAGVANAFANSAFENNLAGGASDELKQTINDRAEKIVESTHRAAGDIGSDLRVAAGEAVDKLRQTGDQARRTVTDTADAGREF
jgi:ElaB/YqjD/DUF883 family membrane-anchored ribosome-binding protein